MKPLALHSHSSDKLNSLSNQIINAAICVHRELGPGLLESAYEACLAYELDQRGLKALTQIGLPVAYGSVQLDVGYRVDIVVEDAIILELKSVVTLTHLHEAQLLSYLRLSGASLGFLFNFNVSLMKDGIKRVVNQFQ